MMNIRAEKTTQNRDDFRVLLAGILITIFLIAVKPYVFLFWETSEAPICTPVERIDR